MRRKKKIFKPKRHYKIKRRNENAVKIIAGAAAVAALIFVGYSVAGPIGRYIASRPDRTETQPWTPTDTDDTAAQTAELPAVTDITQSDISLPVSEEAQTSAAAVTEPAETTVTTVSEQTAALRDGGAAYYLDPDSMSDADSLDAALDELAASGCNAVIFPVKTEGGVFHYKNRA